jgi:hypothetical protein
MKNEQLKSPAQAASQQDSADTEGKSLAAPKFNLTANTPVSAPEDGSGEGQAEGKSVQKVPEGSKVSPSPQLGSVPRTGTTVALRYAAPLVNSNLQVSPSETMIFRVLAEDTAASSDQFENRFQVTGDAEFNAQGSGLTRLIRKGLDSTNVELVTGGKFNAGKIEVVSTIYNVTKGTSEITTTWVMIPRVAEAPTGLEKIDGPGPKTWVPVPGIYGYKAIPDRGKDGKADYEGQTVLERFGLIDPLGFTMADLKEEWKLANPTYNTPERVARYLWSSGGNGTFVFNTQDLIYDSHNGFGAIDPFKPKALKASDGVGYRLPQEYVVGGNVIARCTIDRRYTQAKGEELRKSDPV